MMEELEKSLENKGSMSFNDLQSLSRQVDDIKVHMESRLEQIKRKLWIQKVHLLRSYKESKAFPNNPIRFTELKNCLLEGYEYLSSKEVIQELRGDIQYMEHLIKEIEDHLNGLSNTQEILEGKVYMLYGFIDIKEEIIDLKAQTNIASAFDSQKNDEKVIQVLKIVEQSEKLSFEEAQELPSDGDVIKIKKTPGKKGKDMELEASPRMLTRKRKALMMKSKENDDSEHQNYEELAMNQYDNLNKMIKKDAENSVKKRVEKKMKGKDREVIDEDRKKAKKKLLEALNANDYFKEVQQQEEIVKKLEMDIFSELSKRSGKYRKITCRIAALLFRCGKYKMISNKIVKSNFSFLEIKNIKKKMIDLEKFEKQLTQEDVNNDLRNHIIAAEKQLDKANVLEDSFKTKYKKISLDCTEPTKEDQAHSNKESGEMSGNTVKRDVEKENNKFSGPGNSLGQSSEVSGCKQNDNLCKQVMMILDGNLKHDLINKGSKESVRCSFYTCENYGTVKRFPKLSNELTVAGRVQKLEALKFIEKIWNRSQEELEKRLFFGWVCAEEKHQGHFRQIAKRLEEDKKVACVVYGSVNAGMYLVSPSDVRGELEGRYNWRANSTQGSRLEPLLFFVVYLKQNFIFSQEPSIEPIVVGSALPS